MKENRTANKNIYNLTWLYENSFKLKLNTQNVILKTTL